jgi:hypothetical protein
MEKLIVNKNIVDKINIDWSHQNDYWSLIINNFDRYQLEKSAKICFIMIVVNNQPEKVNYCYFKTLHLTENSFVK